MIVIITAAITHIKKNIIDLFLSSLAYCIINSSYGCIRKGNVSLFVILYK